jgi:RND family efflux transporter MFP subunit
MSPTMLLGRVVLPAAGMILAAALTWKSVRSITAESARIPAVRLSVSTQQSGRIIAEGRVVAYPGAEVTVGTEVLGTIITMPATEKAVVKAGDLLAELRADEVRASLREAYHRLTEAEVGLRLEQARSRLDRLRPLVAGKDSPQTDRREFLAAAQAHRDAAKAAVERLEAESAKYRIIAPIDGVVLARHADRGETVGAASPLFTIVDLSRLRIEAEVDEFDVANVVPKARATITAEGYPGRRWNGEVEEIADAVVARSSRPQDPGRPADIRVLPVKVAIEQPSPLKLGQRVEVEIVRREPVQRRSGQREPE